MSRCFSQGSSLVQISAFLPRMDFTWNYLGCSFFPFSTRSPSTWRCWSSSSIPWRGCFWQECGAASLRGWIREWRLNNSCRSKRIQGCIPAGAEHLEASQSLFFHRDGVVLWICSAGFGPELLNHGNREFIPTFPARFQGKIPIKRIFKKGSVQCWHLLLEI